MGKRSGQPCIRGLRLTVWDVLNWLAGCMTEREILDDYPELEAEDFLAIYEYALSDRLSSMTVRLPDAPIQSEIHLPAGTVIRPPVRSGDLVPSFDSDPDEADALIAIMRELGSEGR